MAVTFTALWQRSLPLLLLAVVLLAGAGGWSWWRLYRQSAEDLALAHELSITQQRLENQQHTWRELRELHQQEVGEQHFFNTLLHAASRLLEISRISIWLLEERCNTLICRASLHPALLEERLDLHALGDDYLDSLKQSPGLAADDAQHDPRLGGLKKEYLLRHQVVSILEIGIFVGGELRGIICCESLEPRQWRTDEISVLMSFSGLLSQFAESLRRREAETNLYRQIHYDEVTGLPTLRGLDDGIERALAKGVFHVGVLRIGGLSHVNETLGQQAGDEALRQVVTLLERLAPKIDQCIEFARMPSNRLALLLPRKSRERVQEEGTNLLAELNAQSWLLERMPMQLQFAMGVASYPRDSRNFDRLLQRAELALEQARNGAPYHLAFYNSELSEWRQRQNQLERELRNAMDGDEFRLHLQPQFTRHGQLHGAEVLVRWNHPRRGLVPPGDFIPEAERSGLIQPIGYWILQQAIELLSGELRDSGLTLSVNVSVQQLRDDDFVPRVAELMQTWAMPRGRLVLEVVESLLITPGMVDKLEALRVLGIHLSLDDFGTGYSSLRYLQDFRVDEIKLDKVFIVPLRQRQDAPLARSIIALAKALELRLVAEGIECSAQVEFLCQQGVELLQGFHLARPEPIDAFLQRLEPTILPPYH